MQIMYENIRKYKIIITMIVHSLLKFIGYMFDFYIS